MANETFRDVVLFFGTLALGAFLFCGCVTEHKAVDVGGKGVYVDSRSGKMAVGSVSVSTVPADTESAVLTVDEDTAWITDTFTRDIYLRLTGTNAVSHVTDVVSAICGTFSATAPVLKGNVQTNVIAEVVK